MAGGNITKEDIRHDDIVDAVELASDGLTSIIFTGATVVSTTSSTKTVVLSGVDLLRDPEIVENLDLITLAGTSGGAADGDYTVDARVSSTSFTVNETIADSTGGTCEAQNPSGARRTGVDPTNITNSTAKNVQTVLEDLDSAIVGGGITEAQHEALDTLTHDLTEGHTVTITKTSGKVSQVLAEVTPGGTDIRKVDILTRTSGKVSTLRVTQYDGTGVTIKRQLDLTLNRTAGKVTSITVVRTV